MSTTILTALLALSIAHAEDRDTFCGVTEGQSTANIGGTRMDSRIVQPYTLGTLPGTRVVGICMGRVHNVTWNRVYAYGISEIEDTPVGTPDRAGNDVANLLDMFRLAGWTLSSMPDTDQPMSNGWDWRYLKDGDERVMTLREYSGDGAGGMYYVLSITTATDGPCTTGM